MAAEPVRTGEPARYTQLVDVLRQRIATGNLAIGDQLPTELALAQQHQISRGTVRQAMSVLLHEGLIERVQGRGTFVREQQPAVSSAPERRIGLVLNRPSQLDLDILIGVEQAARSRGYRFTFTYTDERAEQLAPNIERMRADQVAGIIICLANDVTSDETIRRLTVSGMPLVLVDRYLANLETDYVTADNATGGYRATEHLLLVGQQRVGFVYTNVGTLQTTSVYDRWVGYRQALEHYGVPFDESLVFCCPYTRIPQAEPPAELIAFLARAERPAAIFAIHDQLALHILQAARQIGLHVPIDLAVIGFDNLSYAEHLNPPLTTVAQPRMEIGLRAGHLLIDRIEGQTGSAQHIELFTSLIVRESCGARRHVQRLRELAAPLPA